MTRENMKKNIGTKDRLVRFILAIILFVVAFWQESLIALLLGLFTLFEACASWCILYQWLGKNTCKIG
jgi:hypothetical protein